MGIFTFMVVMTLCSDATAKCDKPEMLAVSSAWDQCIALRDTYIESLVTEPGTDGTIECLPRKATKPTVKGTRT